MSLSKSGTTNKPCYAQSTSFAQIRTHTAAICKVVLILKIPTEHLQMAHRERLHRHGGNRAVAACRCTVGSWQTATGQQLCGAG